MHTRTNAQRHTHTHKNKYTVTHTVTHTHIHKPVGPRHGVDAAAEIKAANKIQTAPCISFIAITWSNQGGK